MFLLRSSVIRLTKFGHFKRDFIRLLKNGLQEKTGTGGLPAIGKVGNPVDIYLETGFENLSHFSYAFKKQVGYAPTTLIENIKE